MFEWEFGETAGAVGTSEGARPVRWRPLKSRRRRNNTTPDTAHQAAIAAQMSALRCLKLPRN